MTQEQQLVWPPPPHHDYADAQAARASSDCLIALFDGRKLFGNILRFLPDGEVVEFRPMQNGKVLQVPFDEIKNLRLIRPVTFRSRDIKLAEMLIARRAAPDPAALADPGVALKSVLRSPVAG